MSLLERLRHALPPDWIARHVPGWIAEDIPNFDLAGAIVGDAAATAQLWGKSSGILAGRPFFEGVFEYLDCTVEWHATEGHPFDQRIHLATVRGPINRILQGERPALNILARVSGIVTQYGQRKGSLVRGGPFTCCCMRHCSAYNISQVARMCSVKAQIVGTRKTTPGLRLFEKYALLVADCGTHRFDLSSCLMLKDNHIDSVGSVKRAVEDARKIAGHTMRIEVECRTEAEALEAAKTSVDIIMLDNFRPKEAIKLAAKLKSKRPDVLIEVSGGVTVENVGDYASSHIDIISSGALVHQAKWLDFSLKVVPKQPQQ